jgi:hypothetical protein
MEKEEKERIQALISDRFPSTEFSFLYGSKVFQQAGYNEKKLKVLGIHNTEFPHFHALRCGGEWKGNE